MPEGELNPAATACGKFMSAFAHNGLNSDITACPLCARNRSGTSHSITSSARPSSMGGILNPIVRAVLRLTLSRNLVGNSTGRSDVSIHWGSNWGYHIPDEQKI